MRLSYGDDIYPYGEETRRKRGLGFRFAVLPLIAMFANLSLPTQAALPEIAATDGMAPQFRVEAAQFPISSEINVARFAGATDLFPEGDIKRRFGAREIGGGVASPVFDTASVDADRAILRAFPDVARERFAGAASSRAGFVSDGRVDGLQVAYAPYDARKVVWSHSTFLSATPTPTPAPRKGTYSWSQRSLPKSIYSNEQQACLATAIYFEARGESRKGQAAVAQVILNRVRNPAWPDTACGVVYQNAQQYKRCQFSFACDGVADRIGSASAYERAKAVAMGVTSGELYVPEIGSATHYFADYVRPKWANSMIKVASIGDHHFYRTHSGGWK